MLFLSLTAEELRVVIVSLARAAMPSWWGVEKNAVKLELLDKVLGQARGLELAGEAGKDDGSILAERFSLVAEATGYKYPDGVGGVGMPEVLIRARDPGDLLAAVAAEAVRLLSERPKYQSVKVAVTLAAGNGTAKISYVAKREA